MSNRINISALSSEGIYALLDGFDSEIDILSEEDDDEFADRSRERSKLYICYLPRFFR